MNNKSGLAAIGAVAGLAAIKQMISGSPNNDEKPDCSGDNVGKTGEIYFDIFEGHTPKTWFSLMTDNLYHPLVPGDIKPALAAAKRGQLEAVTIPREAGVSIIELRDTLNGKSINAIAKIAKYLVVKKGMSQEKVQQKIDEVLTSIRHTFSVPESKHAYLCLRLFLDSGSNVAVIGPNMQAMLEHTKMEDITLDNIKMPFETVYVALPGFDGLIHHPDSGYHCIRGVSLHKISTQTFPDETHSIYGVTIWGKPKFSPITGYDDFFIFSGIPNMGPGDLDAYIEKTFHKADFRRQYQQPSECVNDVVRAVKIAFNLIMYWDSVDADPEKIHPDIKALLDKLKVLRERNRKLKPKSTKYKKNLNKINDIRRKLPGYNIHWIEKTDAQFEREYRERQAKREKNRDPNKPKRKSPEFHIRDGHWRVYKKGTPEEYTIWIKSMPVGGGCVVPRLWKSRLQQVTGF